mmetsp:Transcript_55195/g.66459  ORF Transcript_55195/g.66459 Transcript_55195/m.66459 type:complete len:209 (-) Transcript_55195:621-1247(-)
MPPVLAGWRERQQPRVVPLGNHGFVHVPIGAARDAIVGVGCDAIHEGVFAGARVHGPICALFTEFLFTAVAPVGGVGGCGALTLEPGCDGGVVGFGQAAPALPQPYYSIGETHTDVRGVHAVLRKSLQIHPTLRHLLPFRDELKGSLDVGVIAGIVGRAGCGIITVDYPTGGELQSESTRSIAGTGGSQTDECKSVILGRGNTRRELG